jgi:hypothetical protein
MKLLVAVPAYSGAVTVDTVRSLLQEQTVAAAAEIELRAVFLPGCSLITMARNQLAQDFIDSDCDKLVFVDSDVSWEAGSILKLAMHDVDFVGGAYRFKDEAEGYPVEWANPGGELWAENGLLEVASVPGGFMCLTRDVFSKLREAYPDRGYTHQTFSGFAYFDAPFEGGRLYGEDTHFCALWRRAGGRVWLDPELSLTHHGGNPSYAGHIGNFLKGRIAAQVLEAA